MRLVLATVCVCLVASSQTASVGESIQSAAERATPRVDKPDPKQILQQVLLDVLTNPNLKSSRDFYGTPGNKRIALRTDSPVAWPKGWWPKVPGYDFRFRSSENPVLDFVYWYVPYGVEIYSYILQWTPRLLGVQLNTFNLDPRRAYDEQICVSLFNIGGAGGEPVVVRAVGGCIVHYTLKREKGMWAVEYEGSFDP